MLFFQHLFVSHFGDLSDVCYATEGTCKEDGLQEMNVRVNMDTRCRIDMFSSGTDCWR